MRKSMLGVTALAALYGFACPAARAANYKGTMVIIDPYNATDNPNTPTCNPSQDLHGATGYGIGPDWLNPDIGCDDQNNPPTNQVPGMLQRSQLTGIYLRVQWQDFVNDTPNGGTDDTNYPTLVNTLAAIQQIARPSGTSSMSITIGLSAGQNTPCSELQTVDAIALVNPGMNSNTCQLLPLVWNSISGLNLPAGDAHSGDQFAMDYVAAVKTLVNKVNRYFVSHQSLGASVPAAVVTAIKLGGLNGQDVELAIPGDNNPNHTVTGSAVNPQQSCNFPQSGQYVCQSGVTNAQMLLSSYDYYPQGVEATWQQIVSGLYKFSGTLNPVPELQMDTLNGNNFPPIENTTPGAADPFTCFPPGAYSSAPCGIASGDQPFNALVEQAVGTQFFENVLIYDLFSQTQHNGAPPIATPSIPFAQVSAQNDGLNFAGNPDNQSGNPMTPSQAQHAGYPGPIPCWLYLQYANGSNSPVIGMQSDRGNDTNGGANITQYLGGLNWGIQFGSKYEEVWPFQVEEYIKAGGLETTIGMNVTHTLMGNAPSQTGSSNNCYN